MEKDFLDKTQKEDEPSTNPSQLSALSLSLSLITIIDTEHEEDGNARSEMTTLLPPQPTTTSPDQPQHQGQSSTEKRSNATGSARSPAGWNSEDHPDQFRGHVITVQHSLVPMYREIMRGINWIGLKPDDDLSDTNYDSDDPDGNNGAED